MLIITEHICLAAEDCIKDVYEALWREAFQSESQSPPPFYPNHFKERAVASLQQLGITQEDIKATNMKLVYLHLISSI